MEDKKVKKNSWIKTAVVLVLIVGSIVYFESQKGRDQPVELTVERAQEIIEEKSEKFLKAQEITSPDGFINTEEFALADYIGEKVILIDFWTYSCVNCQRTFPYLNAWHKAYEDEGLVIIGIHTPEFDFEEEYDNVLDATERFDIEFPVVLDNDFSTWRAYQNQYWPRKYLIDIDGFIVYDHIGEGAYDETEAKIVELLNERKVRLGNEADLDAMAEVGETVSPIPGTVKTRETYFGYERLEYISNDGPTLESCINASEICNLVLPETVPENLFALEGSWLFGEESSVLVSDTGVLISEFEADKVNLVAQSLDGVNVRVYLDGELVDSKSEGRHVKNGVVEFKESKLYNLIDLKGNPGPHTMKLEFESTGAELFAFTFG